MIWQATVAWTATDPAGVSLEDLLDALTDVLADRGGAVGPEGDSYVAVLTIEAGTLRQASVIALSAVTAAAAAAGQTHVVHQAVEVITATEADRRIMAPAIPDVVDTREAAEILGVTRQRVLQIAGADPRFPHPLLTVSGAPVYVRAAMEAYAAQRAPRPGRPKAS